MRRIAVSALAVAALTGCGTASPSTSPAVATKAPLASPSPASPRLLAAPVVTVMPSKLAIGVGRAALIQRGATAILAGGLVVGDGTTDAVQQMNLATGVVTRLPSLAVPVHDTAGAALADGTPYVIGGGNTSEQSAVQAFRNGAWRVVGHLPTTRSDLSALSGTESPTVFGGYDGSTPAVASVLMLKAPSLPDWFQIGTIAVPVRYAAAVENNGGALLFGGEVSNVEQSVVQTFDFGSGTGKVVAHLPQALGHMTAVAVGGRILVLGGRTTSGGMSDRMWWFDPTTNHFSDAGRLPYALADAVAAVYGDNVYVLGGESPHPIRTILKIEVLK